MIEMPLPLGRSAVPEASVPMRLFWMVVSFDVSTVIPEPFEPEIRLPTSALGPPIRLPGELCR